MYKCINVFKCINKHIGKMSNSFNHMGVAVFHRGGHGGLAGKWKKLLFYGASLFAHMDSSGKSV